MDRRLPNSESMHDFSAAVGEIIIWANMIDYQLGYAIVRILVLPSHAMTEPLVSQLDARPKIEILKKRLKFLPKNSDWRIGISTWLKDVEGVMRNRNTAAHCRIQICEDRIELKSSQLTKIFDSLLPNLASKENHGLDEIHQWIEKAKICFSKGQTVIENLDNFAEEVRRRRVK